MRKLMRFVLPVVLIVVLAAPLVTPAAARAQDDCGNAPPPRLTLQGRGRVSFTDGTPLNVRGAAGLSGAVIGQVAEGTPFDVVDGPVCADSIFWWAIATDTMVGWAAEGADGEYFVEPLAVPETSGAAFVAWDWAGFVADGWGSDLPDPMALRPPAVYAGDLPPLPVDLSQVKFLEDAGLNDAQRALLAQNGFVVVPAGADQFETAYRESYTDTETWWTYPPDYDGQSDPIATGNIGHAYFVTTDATLHALHYIFDNLLTDLERASFDPIIYQQVLQPTLQAAVAQRQQAMGTPLEAPATTAELFLGVALELFAPGEGAQSVSPDLADQVTATAAMALAGSGQYELPFLPGYLEDFSQYRPRGHYEGDAQLEEYFRGMMWLSRITFRAKDDAETLTALMLLRALRDAPGALDGWRNLHDTLTFLIGPVDDLGPQDYAPLAEAVFGADLALDNLADPTLLPIFKDKVDQLPAPRVNGLILPNDTEADQMAEETRGFRFLGQRFTFDGYVMQQLMYPFVGTRENPRLLPLGLDVASVTGSETAYALAADAGATTFVQYDTQTAMLRTELSALRPDNWLENTYGGWLWTLQPLWSRDSAAYPPLMNTEAWWRKDLQTGLASWTELKHDTVLYAKQPTGFGGGGAPLTSFGYVEPNPLVFARIAVVAAMTYEGIIARGLDQNPNELRGDAGPATARRAPGDLALFRQGEEFAGLQASLGELRTLAVESARFADIARKELAGEPLTEDDYWAVFGFGNYLNILLRTLYQGEGEPDPVALVTDVASNPSAGMVLQEGVGGVDLIYVVVPAPIGGWQLVRGGVFSYYEWVGDINQRMTDSEWRAAVRSGDLPPRPTWIGAFYSE
jgi:hypothetical protein